MGLEVVYVMSLKSQSRGTQVLSRIADAPVARRAYQACTVKKLTGIADFRDVANRRANPRFPADQPVTVKNLSGEESHAGPGTIVNFSASGLCVQIGFPVFPGARLEVAWDRGVILGESRYCRRTGPGTYTVGLKIAELKEQPVIRPQTGVA
jgi:hypothetical protein